MLLWDYILCFLYSSGRALPFSAQKLKRYPKRSGHKRDGRFSQRFSSRATV